MSMKLIFLQGSLKIGYIIVFFTSPWSLGEATASLQQTLVKQYECYFFIELDRIRTCQVFTVCVHMWEISFTSCPGHHIENLPKWMQKEEVLKLYHLKQILSTLL